MIRGDVGGLSYLNCVAVVRHGCDSLNGRLQRLNALLCFITPLPLLQRCRILCLHGMRTNANVMEVLTGIPRYLDACSICPDCDGPQYQVANIKREVGNGVEFVCIDAPVPSAEASDPITAKVFPDQVPEVT